VTFVDLGDGRHTRVHLRSFQAAGLNPRNLSVGDTLQLKKLCYIGKYHVTKWRIQQAPVGAHCQEAVRHLASLAAAMESQKEETKGKLLCIERLKLTRGLTPCDTIYRGVSVTLLPNSGVSDEWVRGGFLVGQSPLTHLFTVNGTGPCSLVPSESSTLSH